MAAQEDNTIMIQIDHLSKRFGDLEVLKDINTTIKKGDVISIIGPSGTGKSTFLRCLNLLEKPTGGKIVVEGENILRKGCDVASMRRRMGMVFQSFNLFDHLTIMENLTIGQIKLLGRNTDEAEAKGLELLKMVGLAEKRDAMPSQLSGGQKQRIAIARCLSMDPDIILFDEPTSALDPTMVSEVLSVIRRLSQTGITMLIVTHEMNFARDVSSRIFFMDQGYIWEEGAPEKIFNNPDRYETRAFINHIRGLHFSITSADYDLYSLNSHIEQFSAKNYFNQHRVHSLMHIVEELLQVLNPMSGIDIQIEYLEKDDQVLVDAIQHDRKTSIVDDPETDDLAMTILRGSCVSFEERIVEKGIEFKLNVK